MTAIPAASLAVPFVPGDRTSSRISRDQDTYLHNGDRELRLLHSDYPRLNPKSFQITKEEKHQVFPPHQAPPHFPRHLFAEQRGMASQRRMIINLLNVKLKYLSQSYDNVYLRYRFISTGTTEAFY
jgi:hypothetical protein